MYSTNNHLPRIRRDVAIFAKKYGIRKASRHYGYAVRAIHRWTKVLDKMGHHPIPTKSSRPHTHPRTTDELTVKKIVDKRIEVRRSAEVVHEYLRREGTVVSLATVKRTLKRKKVRMYTFILIDVCSRWVYAKSYQRMNSKTTL